MFKSKAVIQLNSTQTTNVTTIPTDPKMMNCWWNNVGYYCISMELHLSYTGEGVMDQLELDVAFSLDHGAVRKRAVMLDGNNNELAPSAMKTVEMQKGVQKQISVLVFVKMLGISLSSLRT